MTNPILQKLAERLHVVDVRSLTLTCAPYAEEFEAELPFTRDAIGMIVSIEASKAASGQKLESWRLGEGVTAGISRHFTKFFHTDEQGTGALKDLIVHETRHDALRQRGVALADTLREIRNFLAAEDVLNKKLVLHCIRGIHRSPALALAVLFDQYPDAPAKEIFSVLKTVCSHPPQLRAGELAFIAAFSGRKMSVIDEWLEIAGSHNNPGKRFDRVAACSAYEKCSEVLGSRSAAHPSDTAGDVIIEPPSREQVGSTHPAKNPKDPRY